MKTYRLSVRGKKETKVLKGETPVSAFEEAYPGKELIPVTDEKKATVRMELLDGERSSTGFYIVKDKPVTEKVIVPPELKDDKKVPSASVLFVDDDSPTFRMHNLRKELQKAADDYYNGTESMSNFEYDKKFDELKLLEGKYGNPEENFTDRVGAELEENSGLEKVRHEFEAKSLSKTKDVNELQKEQSKTSDGMNGFTCLSWKMDGCTCQLTYEGGKLILAATRGDGKIGQNITRNVKYIEGIPEKISYTGKLVVRGEVVMSYEEFERINTDGQFANPRNLASATITALDKKVLAERHTQFKAFELVYAEPGELDSIKKSFNASLDYLGGFGFGVVEHTKVMVKDLPEKIAQWSTEKSINGLGLPVDGLVVAYDDTTKTAHLEGTGHHPSPTKAMAFKWADEEVPTILRDIEWSPSRTGLLNPVAIFDTVDLCGTKVGRASLHNVSYIKSLNLKVGDRISVYKANMIIPQIAENFDRANGVANTSAVQCPCCGQMAEVVSNNDTLVMMCKNKGCLAKNLGTFTHYVDKHGMNIDGLSEKTILTLMENGLVKQLCDLYTLKDKREAFVQIDGLGEKSFDKLVASIEKSRETDTEHFLYACGIDGISRGQIKEIVDYIRKNWDTELKQFHKEGKTCEGPALFACLISMAYQDYPFSKINGIGEVLGKNLQTFIDDELIFPMEEEVPGQFWDCTKFLHFMDTAPSSTTSGGSSKLAGKTFVITGTLVNFANREALVSVIEKNGGRVSGSVSAKTSYLINNDVTSTSGKNKKAQELHIPIISESDFLALLM